MKWALALCLVTACSSKHDKPSPPPTPPPTAAPADAAAPVAASTGIDTAGMNTTVKPGDNFFGYANGTWLDKTEIPADHAAWGTGAILAEATDKRVADLIEEAAKTAAPGTDARRVGDYFATYMDQAAIESKGIAPIQPELDAIAAIKDKTELARALGGTVRADVDVLNATSFHTQNIFGLWVAQDLDDPTKYSPFLLQGGLGLPDRDYYLSPAPKMAEIRTKYEAYVAGMLKLAKVADPDAKAKQVVALETLLAKAHESRADSEDVKKGDNHWKLADLVAKAPGLDWTTFVGAIGLPATSDFVIWQPSATIGIAAAVGSQPLDAWKALLLSHVLTARASVLPKAFGDANFAFFGGVLSGVPEMPAIHKRAVHATEGALSEAVGKLYVDRYFPPEAKARAEAMAKELIVAMGARIDHLDWMAPATKEKAKAKLAALHVYVGYPDKWRDYSKLEIVAGDALGNAERAGLFELHRNLDKLGKPVDRSEWAMDPETVDAVNLPAMNALNFPAAILQPPFFDAAQPAAANYGSIGSVIGHEISHSFDDQGAMFDSTGKLANWWTPADLTHFKAAGARLAAEFDAYQPLPDMHVNGKQTLSENIADVAGLAVAYDAYHASLGGTEPAKVEGFTGDQQFFLAFAQGWRNKVREAALRRVLLTDGHAPPEFRADTVRNLDAWYAAFGVTDGKLFLAPADRVRVW
ncbi:MAG TPA: M13 family metallopeptidase [Kofleriaceae bacterium]